LYGLGAPLKRIRRFEVFDPDDGLEPRCLALLGQQVADRFVFHTKRFAEAIGILRDKG
jgi:hypothetical protein